MPNLTHEQIHEFLLGIGALQHVIGERLVRGPDGRPDAVLHRTYVSELRALAGKGDPATITQLVVSIAVTHSFAPEHDAERAQRQRDWELAQVRRLFPD